MENGILISIALENGNDITGMPDSWHLALKFTTHGMDWNCPGTILSWKSRDKECLVMTYAQDSISCRIYTDAREIPICLRIPLQDTAEKTKVGDSHVKECNAGSHDTEHLLTITYRPFHISLYFDGVLMDEDWPLGDFCTGNSIVVTHHKMVLSANLAGVSEKPETEPDIIKSFTLSADHWRPEGHNTGVGDCMPWFHEDRFHLFYLFDRRGHKSKYGLGAHQWAHVSTKDLKTWDVHPLAIAIDSQWEGSICTSSVFTDKGIHYAFYAVRMSDGSAAKLSWATSNDGIRFTKTHRYFTLKAPYEPVSARDPFVFKDDSGLFHMLVTTSVTNDEGKMEGCLAHLVSTNLEEWLQKEPYLIDGGREQPECSDLFEMNGWHYLIYGLCGTGRCRMSRNPFGPWVKPENDIIDDVRYRVPKTASFTGGRRLAVGFVTATPEAYAGCAVFRELVQQPDGTLSVEPVKEMTEMMKISHVKE